MRRLIYSSLIAFSLSFSITASPQTPPDVMKAYKEYKVLFEKDDVEATKKKAFEAWQLAEEKMGDSQTTANLAVNYLDMAALSFKKNKDVDKGFDRVIDLAKLKSDDERALYVTELYYKHANYHNRRRNHMRSRSIAKKGVKYATEAGLEKSTFLGELYTLVAASYVARADNKQVGEYAQKALDTFEQADDGFPTAQPLLARLYSGYAKEDEDDILDAALEYQQVMETIDGVLPRNHPFMMRALGRWSSMRERLSRNGLLDEAEEKGLCKCWPYDKPRNEAIKPIKRATPKMPARAPQSGFSIVEFDLADDGTTKNVKILESWPEGIFEKSSEKAVLKWVYPKKTAEQTESDRTEFITTVRYILADEFGNVIE